MSLKNEQTAAERNRTLFLNEEEKLCLNKQLVLENEKFTEGTRKENVVLWEDCFKALRKLKKKSVDLLICDPPYNLTKTYGQNTFREQDKSEYLKFTREWIELVLPLLKSTASLYICSDWKSSLLIAPILSDYFVIQNRITWEREKGRGAKANWKNNHEDIWFCTIGKDYYFNPDAVRLKRKVLAPYKENGKPKDWKQEEEGNFRLTAPSNLMNDITIPFWSMPENTNHPTQKPEKLMAKLILASSKEGDLVLDPFLGSGTTCVVAKKLGRKYIGIEKEEEYALLASKRLELAELDKSIQGYEDGFFYERNTLNQLKTKVNNKQTKLF